MSTRSVMLCQDLGDRAIRCSTQFSSIFLRPSQAVRQHIHRCIAVKRSGSKLSFLAIVLQLFEFSDTSSTARPEQRQQTKRNICFKCLIDMNRFLYVFFLSFYRFFPPPKNLPQTSQKLPQHLPQTSQKTPKHLPKNCPKTS